MARPVKQGLDYYPMDVNILADVKMRRIIKYFGAESIAVILSVLGMIYADEGYYLACNDDLSFLISEETGVSEDMVKLVLGKAIEVDFFNKGLFEKENVISSTGVQKRFFKAVERRKKIDYKKEYLLIDEVQLNGVIDSDNEVNVCNNSINDNINEVNVCRSTQSKVNKKVNKKVKLVGEHANKLSGVSSYGKFGNVELSEQELKDIRSTYEKPMLLIDKVSGIIANLKTKRDNHHAYIYTIAENDGWPRKVKRVNENPKKELSKQEQAEAEKARAEAMSKIKDLLNKGEEQ